MLKLALDKVRFTRYQRGQIGAWRQYRGAVAGRRGIEIGGPSRVFRTMLPVYEDVGSLDGANFSNDTMWEGRINDGAPFEYYGRRPGKQIIADATDLSALPDESYEFLLSSNCLEHIANPIKALTEWVRVVESGGSLVLVLPKKESNFDHRRPVTTFAHLWDDYSSDVGEGDLTHLDEILALHDLKRDKPAGTLAQFRERSLRNFDNRGLHHHVFDAALIDKLCAAVGLQAVDICNTHTDYFALARKP